MSHKIWVAIISDIAKFQTSAYWKNSLYSHITCSSPLERPPYGSQKSGLSREVVFLPGEKRPMKQIFVPRYSGLSREVVFGQGGLLFFVY